ncbi:TPA: SIR2 family protein, partial [Streptococcus suis]|nr:SIR2 family protein [Streptococcus suis]
MFFFFFDDEKELKSNQIELHYLSNSISYGREKTAGNEFFDSNGVLEKQDSKEGSKNEFQE